jgi:hypothetical protein
MKKLYVRRVISGSINEHKESALISIIRAVVVCACLVSPVIANAALIQYRVEGVVTLVDNADGLVPMSAVAGDPFTITYFIDDTPPPDSNVLDPEVGAYYGVIASMIVTIAGSSFTITPPGSFASYMVASNSDTLDRWTVQGANAEGATFPEVRYSAAVTLYGDSSFLTSEAFLLQPDLSASFSASMTFGATRYNADYTVDAYNLIRGRVLSIGPVSSVPDPSELAR